jgi:hypothetical protein
MEQFNNLPDSKKAELMRGPFGEELLKTIRPCVVPLHWKTGADSVLPSNGSALFVNTGSALFGITAGHVYDAFRHHAEQDSRIVGRLGDLEIDLRQRLISRAGRYDLATFEISRSEFEGLGRRAVP